MILQKIKEYIVNKYCCKYRIPYSMLMAYWAKWLHEFYYSEKKASPDNFRKMIWSFLNQKHNGVYIVLHWSAWDLSLYYLYCAKILSILHKKWCKRIVILAEKRFKDVLNLYKRQFYFVKDLCIDDHVFLERWTESEFRSNLKLHRSWDFLDLRSAINSFNWLNMSFYEYSKNLWGSVELQAYKKGDLKKYSYNYSNINREKIDKILSYYNNLNWLIICNFENKTYKIARKDWIKFSSYVSEITKIGEKKNLKFVINSVYDNEKMYDDKNVTVTRLNFQEIIRLAEHDKIRLFISERNGLNDLFKVFFPKINQIIYYPDYYCFPCVDKNVYYKMYKEKLKHADLKDFWHLPWDNIIEDIRCKFFETIGIYINKLVD